MAAATVLAGTWGSAISPGNAHNPFVADLAGTDMMTVIINETPASVIASIACVAVMTVYAVLRREGATEERRLAYLEALGEEGAKEEAFHVRPLLAIVPLVPLFLLILGSKQVGLLPEISVPLSMLIGVALWGVGMGAQESILKAAVTSMVPKASRATGYGVFECSFGAFWFLGSWLMGVLYDVSIPAMIAVSVIAQLATIPLYIGSSKLMKKDE